MARFKFNGIEMETVVECPFELKEEFVVLTDLELAKLSAESVDDESLRIAMCDEVAQLIWLCRYGLWLDCEHQRIIEWYLNKIDTRILTLSLAWRYRRKSVYCRLHDGSEYGLSIARNGIFNDKQIDAENLFLCAGCDSYHSGERILYNNRLHCEDCAKEMGLDRCELCGSYHTPNGSREFYDMETGEVIAGCNRCHTINGRDAFFCYFHNRWEIGMERYYRGFGYACEGCSDQLTMVRCDVCGATYYAKSGGVDDLKPYEFMDMSFGHVCVDCRCRFGETRDICKNTTLFPYSFKPYTLFFDDEGKVSLKDDGSLHMGFELELDGAADEEACDEFAYEVHSAFGGFIYCKSDCSLNTGAESVSHPATPGYLLNRFDWNELLSYADEHYLDDSENCGFHVHMNREFFCKGDGEEKNIAKMVALFDRFYDKFMRLGLRGEDKAYEWAQPSNCRFCPSDFEGDGDSAKYKLDDHSNGSRYRAVNTTNSHTVEVRLFSASTCVERIKVMLDVLQAVANFCVECPASRVLTIEETELEAEIINRSMYEYTVNAL